MSFMVQFCLGLPTLFLCPMLGLASVFWNVACLVGSSAGSRSRCVKSFICALFTSLEILVIFLGGLRLPFPLPVPFPVPLPFSLGYRKKAARFRTRLLVFSLSMKVVCILRIFAEPF